MGSAVQTRGLGPKRTPVLARPTHGCKLRFSMTGRMNLPIFHLGVRHSHRSVVKLCFSADDQGATSKSHCALSAFATYTYNPFNGIMYSAKAAAVSKKPPYWNQSVRGHHRSPIMFALVITVVSHEERQQVPLLCEDNRSI